MSFESQRSLSIRPSPSMQIAMAARRLQAEGRDVIDLSLGEPDFEPPDHVATAAIAAIRIGGIRYGAAAGTEALRSAIAEKFRRDNGLTYAPDQIVVANGAKQLLFDAFLATLEPGDEVLIPSPCWVSYGDIVGLHGGKPLYLPCTAAERFKLSAERLAAAITPQTRWLLLNSPSNPTGAIYSAAELQALAAVLARHPRVLILSDEIYEHVILGQVPFTSFGTACPGLLDRTLIVNGVSKAYAMTGWRLGYAAGPKPLVAALNKMQSQSVTSVCAVVQAAALAALTGDQAFVAAGAARFAARAQLVADRLKRLPHIHFVPPDGAFYAFIDVSGLIGCRTADGTVLTDDTMIASHLLHGFGLSGVPGSAFAAPGHLRLSIAASEAELSAACDRLQAMIASLS